VFWLISFCRIIYMKIGLKILNEARSENLPSGQKNSLKECVFINLALNIVKNTLLTDCFFGDFAHWVYVDFYFFMLLSI